MKPEKEKRIGALFPFSCKSYSRGQITDSKTSATSYMVCFYKSTEEHVRLSV